MSDRLAQLEAWYTAEGYHGEHDVEPEERAELLALALRAERERAEGWKATSERAWGEKERRPEHRDLVRVGTDFNAVTNASEVTRIDFETRWGTKAVVVERLGSRDLIVVDLVRDLKDPTSRTRIGNFPIGSLPPMDPR